MTAKKKKAKAKSKPAPKKRAQKPAAGKAPPADPKAKSDVQFLNETFVQVAGTLKNVSDAAKRKELDGRLKALRSKYRDLPKDKKTSERVVRYGEELHKIATDIMKNCC
jgi:uncharacterized protein (DUF58 family)